MHTARTQKKYTGGAATRLRIKGGGGVFDVTADSTLVYSKRRTGRFPENAEVIQTLRGLAKN